MPASERGRVPGIKSARADIILAGAAVVQTVLEVGGFAGIEVTEAGLREGVFFESLLPGPDHLFDDVRRDSVLNLARQYRVDRAHTNHVAALALGLFDQLAAEGLHDGDPIERELLWAGCMLHDIGMSVDYDDHHKHSRYLILNAGLPGFAPAEVALIAQAARYHRKGSRTSGELEPLSRARRRRAPRPARAACCASPRISSARATRASARRTSTCRTARSGWTSTPTRAPRSRAGPPSARWTSSAAPSARASPSRRSLGACHSPLVRARWAAPRAERSTSRSTTRRATASSSRTTPCACARRSGTRSSSTPSAPSCCTRPRSSRSSTSRSPTSTRRCSTPTDTSTHCPFKGDASYWTLTVGDREIPDALWAYESPTSDAAWLKGYGALYWDKVDEWYVEDELVDGYLRDPYHRVDVHPSSRPVVVRAAGQVIAESTRPKILLETSLPPRVYIPREDVKVDLEPSDRRTHCAYKGHASYWSAKVDGGLLQDVAWSYEEPLAESADIAGHVSFDGEGIEVELG